MWKFVDLTLTIRDQWRWPVKYETKTTHEENVKVLQYLKAEAQKSAKGG